MGRNVHALAVALSALAFEQPALQARYRLLREEPAARADHSMPGNASAGGAGRDGESGRPGTAGQAKHFGELPVRDDAPARNALHKGIDLAPSTLISFHFAPQYQIGAAQSWQFCSAKATQSNPRRLYPASNEGEECAAFCAARPRRCWMLVCSPA